MEFLRQGSPSLSSPLLRSQGLWIGYPSQPPLLQVEESFFSGELIAIVGRNGSGKSTLLRTWCGAIPPLRGKIWLGTTDASSLSSRLRARWISYSPTRLQVAPETCVEELLALARWPWRERRRLFSPPFSVPDTEAISFALERTGLLGFEKRRVATLSDGERQRVMLALALAQQAKIMLFDEPLAHLDREARAEIAGLLADLVEGGQRLVIYTTHEDTVY